MKHITRPQFDSLAVGDVVKYVTFGGVEKTGTIKYFLKQSAVFENGGGYPYIRIIEIISKKGTPQ